jgi:hypothetical protein
MFIDPGVFSVQSNLIPALFGTKIHADAPTLPTIQEVDVEGETLL